MHHQLTMPALKAKKDVLVEWPLGANTAQAEELAALAKKQNVKTVVALQARTSPLIQKVCVNLSHGQAKNRIDKDNLGKRNHRLGCPWPHHGD